MLSIAVISVLSAVVAYDYCRDNYNTKITSTVCFTNMPDGFSVCPHHQYHSDLHGQVGNAAVAAALYVPYPSNCGPVVDDKQRCTGTIQAWSDATNGMVDYAYVWSDRTINKQGNPSYYFGGMFWLPVCIFPFILVLLLTQILGSREPK